LLLLYVMVRAIIGPRRIAPDQSLASQRIEAALKPVERPEATPAREPVEPELVNKG
jgi:hypothetical protein